MIVRRPRAAHAGVPPLNLVVRRHSAVRKITKKEEAERNTFLRFAMLLDEPHHWMVVQNRRPPEPDLLCQHGVHGPVAFELVSITDPTIAQIHAGHNPCGQSAYFTEDPTERIIRKKLERTYQTQHPVELLVYNDLLVVTPDDAIVTKVVQWLSSKSHPFRRAWYMGEQFAKEVWSSP